MASRFALSLIVFLLPMLSLQAGSFTTDFNSGLPAGTTAYGVAAVAATGGPDGSGCLKMMTNSASQSAAFAVSDLDPGIKIGSFTATFQLVLGHSSGTVADGFSFNFTGNIQSGSINEEGCTNGLVIEFDTYTNNTISDIAGIDVKWNNTEIATHPMSVASLCTWPTYANVTVQLNQDGTLNVNYNGSSIYANLPTGYVPIGGRFALGARTGTIYENCWLDNLSITTGLPVLPQVVSNSPTGTGIRPDPMITVQLSDGTTLVDPSTLQMSVDGNPVTPNVSKVGTITTVQYPEPGLSSGSSNWVVLVYANNATPAVKQTNQFSFIVLNYPTIPASYAATVDTSSSGFVQRVVQGNSATVANIATAETMLGGLLINPTNGLAFPNGATANTDSSYTFNQTGVLNYNVTAPANAGDFTGDVQFPGLPSTAGTTVNYALEAITYLYLTPGAYTFGVNSDDGFRVSSIGMQLGAYDAGRGAADTLFYVGVSQAGYYPFRLVYFQGTGGGSLEWFSVTPAGQKILINDSSTTGYIRAYSRGISSLPYFTSYSPTNANIRPDKAITVQMHDGAGINVNPGSVTMTINGASVTPTVAQSSGVTTVQYGSIFASGTSNYVVVSFADTQATPVRQTNAFGYNMATYMTVPASYAFAGTVDTGKPGFGGRIFQTTAVQPGSIATAETMIAGQLANPLGTIYPNVAAASSYEEPNVINYSVGAPVKAGFFASDVQFPGMPGTTASTNNFALEAITYLYLTAGYYNFGVNSDDGFRLTTAPNPRELFPMQLCAYDGTRTAADTLTNFVISQSGYYPFRLVYFQGSSYGSLEWFSVNQWGYKMLINDTTAPLSVRGYRSANNQGSYVDWVYPYRGGSYIATTNNPVSFTLVDGTPAIQLNSIQVTFNGSVMSPTLTRVNTTNIVVSLPATSFQKTTNITYAVQLSYMDALGHVTTDSFNLLVYGSETLAPVWSLAPGSRTYLTTDTGGLERGAAYNPTTGHLLIVSRSATATLRGVYILDAFTGADVGQLKLTDASGSSIISGGDMPLSMIDVADDGAIYAACMTYGGSLIPRYRVYRWANESDSVAVAYSDGAGLIAYRLGDNFRVRGAGANTLIVASGTFSNALFLTTADGVNFSPTARKVTGIANNALYGGIAFGSSNVFYTKANGGTSLTKVNFSLPPTSASGGGTYTVTGPVSPIDPIGLDLVYGRLVALGVSGTAGVNHTVNLYDFNALSGTASNSPEDTKNVPTTNGNAGGWGYVDLTPDGLMAFVLDSMNGVMAYRLSPRLPAAPTLSYSRYGSQIVLSWTPASATLQSAGALQGVYTNLLNASIPFTNNMTAPARFFRLTN